MADAPSLERVLLAILTRALECAADRAEVALALRHRNDRVELEIAWRGAAIPSAELAAARPLIEAQRGRLEADTHLTGGPRLILFLTHTAD